MFTIGSISHVIHMTDDMARRLDACTTTCSASTAGSPTLQPRPPPLRVAVRHRRSLHRRDQPAFDDDRWNRRPIGRYYSASCVSWTRSLYVATFEGLTELRDGSKPPP